MVIVKLFLHDPSCYVLLACNVMFVCLFLAVMSPQRMMRCLCLAVAPTLPANALPHHVDRNALAAKGTCLPLQVREVAWQTLNVYGYKKLNKKVSLPYVWSRWVNTTCWKARGLSTGDMFFVEQRGACTPENSLGCHMRTCISFPTANWTEK